MTAEALHATCSHKTYRMTCDEFEELRARAAGVCERCNTPCVALQIDHDHSAGLNAVRGLLCGDCNGRLGMVESGRWERNDLDAAYLARAWWAGRGVSLVEDRRTPTRAVRIDPELWQAAMSKARDRRETVSALARRALLAYVEDE